MFLSLLLLFLQFLLVLCSRQTQSIALREKKESRMILKMLACLLVPVVPQHEIGYAGEKDEFNFTHVKIAVKGANSAGH